MPGTHPLQDDLLNSPAVLLQQEAVELPKAPEGASRVYAHLSLRDVFLSYAGYRGVGDRTHTAIAALHPGDRLDVRARHGSRLELVNEGGVAVGQLAASYRIPEGMSVTSATVMAVAVWDRSHSEPEYQKGLKCDRWEVVVPTLILEPSGRTVDGGAG